MLGWNCIVHIKSLFQEGRESFLSQPAESFHKFYKPVRQEKWVKELWKCVTRPIYIKEKNVKGNNYYSLY